MRMQPGVGDMVTYTNLGDAEDRYPPEQHPALITKVNEASEDGRVSLMIFYETGIFIMMGVPYAEEFTRGHWS